MLSRFGPRELDLALGAGGLVPGTWYVGPGAWYRAPTWDLGPGAYPGYPVPGPRYQVPKMIGENDWKDWIPIIFANHCELKFTEHDWRK